MCTFRKVGVVERHSCWLAMSDLSEGELSRSEENVEDSPVGGSGESKTLVEPGEENGDEAEAKWTPVEVTQRKRKAVGEPESSFHAQKKKKKRNRVRSLPSDSEESSPAEAGAEWEKDLDKFYLKKSAKLVLRHFSQLMKADHDCPALPKYRTTDVRDAVRHILTGLPLLSEKGKMKHWQSLKERLESLKERKLVLIWLSMVSCSDFSNSKHLPKLKQQPAQIQCVITHPGSNRYARMGLEAFMEVEHPTRLPNTAEKCMVTQHEFGKADCLLSRQELEVNMFPCDSSSINEKDVKGFMLTDWPGGNLAADNHAISQMPMFALDCEMVVTTEGYELARISLINEMFECILDSLVKPTNPVLDYVTKFSGIDAEMLEDVTTTLEDVQEQVKKLLPACCILVGHSLENDFKALGLCHPYVIDTSLLFTPHATPFCKPKLRTLVKKLLDKEIQTGSSGHCSTEDATACMKLAQLKLEQGAKLTVAWNEQSKPSLLSEVSARGVTAALVDKPSIAHMFGKGATCIMSANDEEVVQGAKAAIANNRFVFLQLHAAENCLKESSKTSQEYGRLLEDIDNQVS